MEKICPTCKISFDVPKCEYDLRRFCSFDCRSKYHSRIITCDSCGMEFKAALSKLTANINSYCSKECYSKALEKKVYSTCLTCGDEIIAKQSANQKFCSLGCYWEYARQTYRGVKDANHDEIVSILLDAGCSVLEAHETRYGCPDIFVGYKMDNYCLEIKTKKGRLTKAQKKFQDGWRGHYAIVRTPEEALKAIGLME